MGNDVGMYVGWWYEISMDKKHGLYDLLRHKSVVFKALSNFNNIEDNEDLCPILTEEIDGPGGPKIRLILIPTNRMACVHEFMGIEGFTDFVNGAPIRRPFVRTKLHKYSFTTKIVECIAAHPDVTGWNINCGICPVIEE